MSNILRTRMLYMPENNGIMLRFTFVKMLVPDGGCAADIGVCGKLLYAEMLFSPQNRT